MNSYENYDRTTEFDFNFYVEVYEMIFFLQ